MVSPEGVPGNCNISKNICKHNTKIKSKSASATVMVQQARRRFSMRSMELTCAGKRIEEGKSSASQDSGSDNENHNDTMEKQSLRQEVEQLKEILRMTTLELSSVNDTVKDLQHQAMQKKELEEILELECETLKQELDECRTEGEEMLVDLLDSSSCLDDFKQRLELKEEAFKILKESYCNLSQERDELLEQQHMESEKANEDLDVFDMQEKLDQFQKRARRDSQIQSADIAELQKRLREVTKERDELELAQRAAATNHRRTRSLASDDGIGLASTVNLSRNSLNESGHSSDNKRTLHRRRRSMGGGGLVRRLSMTTMNIASNCNVDTMHANFDKVLHDAANLIPGFHDHDHDDDNHNSVEPTLSARSVPSHSARHVRSESVGGGDGRAMLNGRQSLSCMRTQSS